MQRGTRRQAQECECNGQQYRPGSSPGVIVTSLYYAKALDLLGAGKANAYDAVLTAPRADTRHWWEELPHDPDELEEDRSPTRPMLRLACFSNSFNNFNGFMKLRRFQSKNAR
jgi:hypothetical protein